MRWLAVVLVASLAFPVSAQEADGAAPDAEMEASSDSPTAEFPTIHLAGAAFVDAIARQGGFEATASYGVARYVDLGLGVDFGTSIGALAIVDLHTGWSPDSLFRPFVQVRGMFHPASGGVGGGAWAGASLELGPGRVKAGPALVVFAPRAGYYPFAALGVIAYEFDLLRPSTPAVAERVRVTKAPPETPAPAPASGKLSGRLTDLDGKPVIGLVRLVASGKQYEASPTFEVELPPGEYAVEAEAPGYLIRGSRVAVKEGETRHVDFQLRPTPKVMVAQLRPEEVRITQQVQFEFSRATILEISYFILDEVADLLLRNPQIRQVRIEGHTDDVGGPDANQNLSEERALAVSKYLAERGVLPTRLQVQGFGLTRPLTSNRSEAGRAKNRRVEFRIVAQ